MYVCAQYVCMHTEQPALPIHGEDLGGSKDVEKITNHAYLRILEKLVQSCLQEVDVV